MSARLVRQIVEEAKGEKYKPVVVFTKNRTYEGEMLKADIPNGTIEIRVKDGITAKFWTALIDIDHIEAISPRWAGA
jgi:hypothetical protein